MSSILIEVCLHAACMLILNVLLIVCHARKYPTRTIRDVPEFVSTLLSLGNIIVVVLLAQDILKPYHAYISTKVSTTYAIVCLSRLPFSS